MHFNCFGRWKIIFNKHLWYRTDCCKVFLSVPLSVCLSVFLSLCLCLSVCLCLSLSVSLLSMISFMVIIIRLSYSTIVLYVYRNHEGLGFLALKYHRKTSFTICFVTSRQHWLGKSKLKNVFISTINLSTDFNISYLTEFPTDLLLANVFR